MRVMLECGFFCWFTPDSLLRISSPVSIFEGVILHDELCMSITILSILTVFGLLNEQNSTLCLCHNSAPAMLALLQPRQRLN